MYPLRQELILGKPKVKPYAQSHGQGTQKGSPGMATVCGSNMTALLREAAVFTPGYVCNSSVAPSDFDRLISGSRLTRTAL